MQATGAIDVYFEDRIEILVADEETFSTDVVKATLQEAQVEFTSLETRSL